MIDAANYSATETLRDGRTVEIRAQRPQDREAMHAAIARISSGSLYRRFFAVRREFSDKETDYFLDIDFVNHVALVVVANEAGQPTIVGGGRYVVVEPGQAEVAFAIIDGYLRPYADDRSLSRRRDQQDSSMDRLQWPRVHRE